MNTNQIVKGVATSALFVLAKGQNSSLAIPLLGTYNTAVAGFVHGIVNSMLVEAVDPYVQAQLKPLAASLNGETFFRLTRATHHVESGALQYGLLYGTGDQNTGFIVGTLADMMRLY